MTYSHMYNVVTVEFFVTQLRIIINTAYTVIQGIFSIVIFALLHNIVNQWMLSKNKPLAHSFNTFYIPLFQSQINLTYLYMYLYYKPHVA